MRRALARALASGALALVGMMVPAIAGPASRGQAAITCSNVASGASFEIKVDYDKGTVDSYPARISDAEISWHDASDGGNYTLDRKSAKLTAVIASSTGGYFLYHRCNLEN